ncbi:efflux RND transporter periplasmic adaptor subunit [Methylibium petroleiphilum]|uniref:efflux RND transporter periplasmic adaptor subunit n=1 Tax=Methylibium petroleiphilum TaxID=105560 RepID=UPI003D2787A3
MQENKRSRKWIVMAVAVAGVIAVAVGLAIGRSAPDGAAAAAPAASAATSAGKPALTVTTTRAETLDWPRTLEAHGSVAAWQEASIGAEIGGFRLTEVRVNVGDRVRRGQVLALMSPDTVQADLAQTRAALAEAEATLAEAQANAERARQLQTTGAISSQQINQYLTAEQTARARLEAQRARLEAEALRLRQTRVLAPDDGVISARTAAVGAVAQPGAEMFRLIRGGRLEWRAEVTATELPRLRAGMPARLLHDDGSSTPGRVRMVAPTIDPQTRNGLVYVDLPANGDDRAQVRAGLFARGEFELGRSPALTLPQSAVVLRDGFSYALRVGPDARLAQVKLATGRRLGERIEVLDGLKAGDLVVASGAGFLGDGDLVRVVPAGPRADAASAP